MQLTYRGVQYNYSPRGAQATQEATVFRALRPTYTLHYRGSVYTVDPNVELNLAVVQPTAQLLYRGATYALNGWTQSAKTVTNQPRFTVPAVAHREFEVTHRNNLQNNIQRRLQAARAKDDQTLISLLERELQQIA